MADLTKFTDIAAEEHTLGSALIDPDAIKRLHFLAPDDFYVVKNNWIFTAMRECGEIDLSNIAAVLARKGQLDECGGSAYLAQLLDVPTALHIDTYAQRVYEAAQFRRAIQQIESVAKFAYGNGQRPTYAEFADKCKSLSLIGGDRRKTGQTRHISAVMSEYMAHVEEMHDNPDAAVGVPTGYHDLDKLIGGGMKPGQLVIVAGRPGMGKTALMAGMMEGASLKHNKKSGVMYTLEMVNEEIVNRLVSAGAGICTQDLSRGRVERDDQWQNFSTVCVNYSDAPIWMNDTPMSIDEIALDVERMKQLHDIDYVMIDFLGLVDSAGDNDYQRATAVAIGAKNIAKLLKIPVILGCQLSRSVETRSDKRPERSDLRDSGRIEEAADVLMMLYRDEYYNTDTDQKNIVEVLVRKQRNGPPGKVTLFFDGRLTSIRNLALGKIVL